MGGALFRMAGAELAQHPAYTNSPERFRKKLRDRRYGFLATSICIIAAVFALTLCLDLDEVNCHNAGANELECSLRPYWLVAAGGLPILASGFAMVFLLKIRAAELTAKLRWGWALGFFLVSILAFIFTTYAMPSAFFGLFMSCGYMLWGWLGESAIGMATPIGLVAASNCLAVGFVKQLVREKQNGLYWLVILLPASLASFLNVTTWRDMAVIFPDEPPIPLPDLEIGGHNE